MIVVLFALLTAPLEATPAGTVHPDACTGTFDRTNACPPPKSLPVEQAPVFGADLRADQVAQPAALPREPLTISKLLALSAAVTGTLGGGAAFAGAFVNGRPPFDISDPTWSTSTTIAAGSLFGLSAGLFGAAVATWVFDPSQGTMRFPLTGGD
jgi:hypothetical protein